MTSTGRVELGRDEARARASLITGVSYEVALDLAGEGDEFETSTTATFGAAAGASTFAEFGGTADAVELNGSPIPPGCIEANRIRLPGLEERNVLRVVGRSPLRRDGTGLHRFVDEDGEAFLHTKFEPYDAHRVFACFDQPDLKAELTLSVRTPPHWIVVANTPPLAVETDGSNESWTRFGPTPLLPTYLFALVAGPFASLHRSHGAIELGLYVRPDRLRDLERDADELFDLTAAGLDWYASQFGRPYPFGPRYDQAFVPEYGFGAMEHPGCITFNERFVFRGRVTAEARRRRAEVILHEMAHMWFGDLVTMRWWDDLWLNEAFATLLSALAQEQSTPIGSAAWQVWLHDVAPRAREADQLPSTHPVSADVADTGAVRQLFDAITYRKGAAVLAQLLDEAGPDAFLQGSRRYFDVHAWGNAERDDFLAALGAAGLPDPSSWSSDWLEKAGLGAVTAVPGKLEQVGCAPVAHLRDQTIEVAWYEEDGDGLLDRGRQRVRVTGGEAPLGGPFGGGRLLVVPNANGRAYVKAVLDETSTDLGLERLGDVEDPIARAVCWGALWDAVCDGRLAPSLFVDAVIRHVRVESVIGVVELLVDRSVAAATAFAADPVDGRSILALSQVARIWLEEAETGSDLQFLWARLFSRVARRSDDLDLLQDSSTGSRVIRGLEVDSDLRWQMIVALAAAGRLDDKDIAAVEAADPTDEGRRQAWTARAARPDRAAKATALSHISDASRSLAERRAAMDGWQQPQQRELLTDFADSYGRMATEMWAQGEETGIAFARAMFPHHTANGTALVEAGKLLSTDLPPGLRRIIEEESARLERYQRARSLDARARIASDCLTKELS